MTPLGFIIIAFSVTLFHAVGVSCIKSNEVVAVEGTRNFKMTCPDKPKRFHSIFWLPYVAGSDWRQPVVIGAGARYDEEKYQYLATTGDLMVKTVEPTDAGEYSCIIQTGHGTSLPDSFAMSISVVQLMVQRNYTNVFEKEFMTNTIRGGVAAGLLIGAFASLCILYSCRHKGPSEKGVKPSKDSNLISTSLEEPYSSRQTKLLSSAPNDTCTSVAIVDNESTNREVKGRLESIENCNDELLQQDTLRRDDDDCGVKIEVSSPQSSSSLSSFDFNIEELTEEMRLSVPSSSESVEYITVKDNTTVIYITPPNHSEL